ncbi:hypothetical protein JYU34_009532 [Plutella xylostella]|uniref:Ig-like domain-containing protein n=1 Tax=Plutella xylostella TaxID=51655 RepID=A0ABQ7QKN6_PLUXY|nr:hypothetical protein JYU34_009532 [Plutella xylostella]
MLWFQVILLCTIVIKNTNSKEILVITECQDQLLKTDLNKPIAKIVDVIIGSTIRLECNICYVKDDYQAKLWYYRKRGSDLSVQEVDLAMESNQTDCKKSMTSSHRLDIQRFNLDDSGIYVCKRYNLTDNTYIIYVLDGIPENPFTKQIKLSQWTEYERTKLDTLNNKFIKSKNEPFFGLRQEIGFTFRLTIVWSSWSVCEINTKQKGMRRKSGKCRLQVLQCNNSLKSYKTNYVNYLNNYFLKDNYDISCQSLSLNITLPEVSKIVRNIPDFEILEACEKNIYNPFAETFMVSRKNEFKYKVTKHIGENSHMILTCPEVGSESTVEWYKNDDQLNSSFRDNMADAETEPCITIDPYNSLYILHATKNEEACYSCVVDGVKMKKFNVIVVSKSKILNQEFIRYSIYLGFVLSLTLTCYCAGICVAWHRRSSFADPLRSKPKQRTLDDYLEEERLISAGQNET